MAGVIIQKNYVSTSINNTSLANNWMVLVYGVTSQGPTKPTLVQSYTSFLNTFGQPVTGVLTHPYVRFLLENGVPVLFRRTVDANELVAAKASVGVTDGPRLFYAVANDAYAGAVGNKLGIAISKNETTGAVVLQVVETKTATSSQEVNIAKVLETFSLGQSLGEDYGQLVYNFVKQASESVNNVSNYVHFTDVNQTASDWDNVFPLPVAALTGGTEPENTLENALKMLSNETSALYTDAKLLDAPTYYPQLRFVTTGGIIDSDTDKQNVILNNLGTFATNCKSSFRVLVDYSLEVIDYSIVRQFAQTVASENKISPAIFAYFGYWGADSNNNYLPGSAGFLTALARSNYTVYSRRMAGTGFTPAYTKPYKEIYIDAYKDWQADNAIQLNPIMIVDAQDNMAIMGSSTLALPSNSLNTKNPAQALDIVCVGDYVTAILNGLALSELKAALDRLSLSSLSNRMSQEVERFVTSGAITKYDLNFDTTQLGKLGIECVLYFAIGLEEVTLTITSTYDTDLIS